MIGSTIPKRVIIAITGATGAVYGLRALQRLASESAVETHLIMSKIGAATLTAETDYLPREVAKLADVTYRPTDVGASIASGSVRTTAMIVAPCSIKTLSAIANSYDADLIARAADVTLKEGRPLVLLLRETPLHIGHIRLMEQAALAGAVIAPPVPAFYNRPTSLDELVTYTVDRVLSRLDLLSSEVAEWPGLASSRGQSGNSTASLGDETC